MNLTENKIIVQDNNYVIMDNKPVVVEDNGLLYQSEQSLENELIKDLKALGYEYANHIHKVDALYQNLRIQIERLNKYKFTNSEWERLLDEYIDKPNEKVEDKMNKIHRNPQHDFVCDDGSLRNIKIIDKQNISNNHLQVINQFEQEFVVNGQIVKNRYDVTILVNGLPLVHIELKKRGGSLLKAFCQIHRYSKDSLNIDHSLFKYVQLFVISTGTHTRYFSNSLARIRDNFQFTITWALTNNSLIHDIKEFTLSFFQKNTILNIITKYCVYNSKDELIVMRPYQIAATERILSKIKQAYLNKKYSTTDGGGYIWHTTGSGKTLTSFKTSQLAAQFDFIDKVLFVVDRKDLDFQTIKEYEKFSKGAVNGSNNTRELAENLKSTRADKKIIVTTIQKLNTLVSKKEYDNLDIYKKHVVFIFDECHRSQFGEAQYNIRKKFKYYYQFGFTGTPIFKENTNSNFDTTEKTFGERLHCYIITDAIRDKKVLKFNIEYNDIRVKYRDAEKEYDTVKLASGEYQKLMLDENRLRLIASHILKNFGAKTYQKLKDNSFNAMFAVESVEAAKRYYKIFQDLQKDSDNPLKIATIFTYEVNEEQNMDGSIPDEEMDPFNSSMPTPSKDYLRKIMGDYNKMFNCNYTLEGNGFENYYRNVSKRVKEKEIDILIVVGMFLTGFDSPSLNTLYVDKNLRYHGLIQAFSRTNRILNENKPCGNIVTFRDLEQATKDAIALFGCKDHSDIIIERNFWELMKGYYDEEKMKDVRGFETINKDLSLIFPDPHSIVDAPLNEQIGFINLYNEYLRLENKLKYYDDYNKLLEIRKMAPNDEEAYKKIVETYYGDLSEDDIQKDMQKLKDIYLITTRQNQDYRSSYIQIKEQMEKERPDDGTEEVEVTFEIETLRNYDIDLQYILDLVFEYKKEAKMSIEEITQAVKRLIRSNIEHREKESLLIEFIKDISIEDYDKADKVFEAFVEFAKQKIKQDSEQLAKDEGLNAPLVKKYIEDSLKRGYAEDTGSDLAKVLPKMNKLSSEYIRKKKTIWTKINDLVKKYFGLCDKID